jgi:hypothetical protein
MGRITVPAILIALICGAWHASAPAAESIPLQSAVDAASAGTANGHAFAHLVDLDPANTYTGGAGIAEDICIRGHSATVDLQGAYIIVLDTGAHTRLDIEYCFILHGSHPGGDIYGGGLVYGPGTQGWIVNNTFCDNTPCGLYLHEVYAAGSVKVVNNIFFANALWGLVRHESQPDLYIRNNDSSAHALGDYGEHCACPTGSPVAILPGTEDLHFSNLILDPRFAHVPEPKNPAWDVHLEDDSPCIGSGEGGLDMGAYPAGPNPAAQPSTWGRIKAVYR